MGRALVLAYGVLAYAFFFATFLYLIGFVGDFVVPKTIDSGPSAPLGEALLVNVAILVLFAVQHTIMARPAFKAWWTRFVPRPIERSTFVLLSTAILALLCWQWRPLGDPIWEISSPALATALHGVFGLGWGTVLLGSFMIDHFDLFGLRQVVLYARGKPYTHPPFVVNALYRFVRHPLMLGFLLAFWATPRMTLGHLVFAAVATGYVLVGVRFEERDLARIIGEPYREYRKRVPMLLPYRAPWAGPSGGPAGSAA